MIADDMGLGKTLSAIATINCFSPRKVLIVTLASVKRQFAREWERFTTHPNLTVGVATSAELPNTDVVVLNYDIVAKHHEALVARGPWDFLILDEAHRVKNPDAQRTKLIFGKQSKRKPIQGVPHRRLIMLTGTPMTSRPVDLWQYCHIADPKGLGADYFRFVKRYCAAWNGPWGLDVSGSSNEEELGHRLRQTFLIRHTKDLLDLPPKFRTVLEFDADGPTSKLLSREASLFDALQGMDGFDAEAEDFEEQVARLAPEAGVEFARTAADLAATRQEVALRKLPMVREFVDNLLDQGEKVIVFAYHKAVVKALVDAYKDRCVSITGDTPDKKRQQAIDAFNADPKRDVFVGQLIAAGTGTNMTAARAVVFAEIDYVPANLWQAEDRAHRIGQTGTVNCYYPVLRGSLDARIMNRLVEGETRIGKVMGQA